MGMKCSAELMDHCPVTHSNTEVCRCLSWHDHQYSWCINIEQASACLFNADYQQRRSENGPSWGSNFTVKMMQSCYKDHHITVRRMYRQGSTLVASQFVHSQLFQATSLYFNIRGVATQCGNILTVVLLLL